METIATDEALVGGALSRSARVGHAPDFIHTRIRLSTLSCDSVGDSF